nr:uncharacterized protein LOC116649792 [Drosophila virilis]
MLVSRLFIIFLIGFANVNIQAIKRKDFDYSELLQMLSLLEDQSTPRIVNNQNQKNTAKNSSPVELGNLFQAVQDKKVDAVTFNRMYGALRQPFPVSYTQTESNIHPQLKEPSLCVPAIYNTAMRFNPAEHSLTNINKIIAIQKLVPTPESTYSNIQNVHVHHHYLNLNNNENTIVKQHMQSGVFPESSKYQSATFRPIIMAHDVSRLNNDLKSNPTYNQADIMKSSESFQESPIWQEHRKSSASSEYTSDEAMEIKTQASTKKNNKATSLQQTDEKEINMLNASKSNFLENSTSTVTPLHNEYTAYDVPLN